MSPKGITELDLQRFHKWLACTEGPVQDMMTTAFVQWLTETPEGDEALRHINNTPRQRFLPFESQEREG